MRDGSSPLACTSYSYEYDVRNRYTVPVSLWERVEESNGPSRVALSPMRIALAGIQIADANGLDAVSMRRVASKLNAGTMSLYRYVASRDELVELMVDQVYSTFTVAPRTGDWRHDLAEAARRIHDITLEHPWLAGQSVARLGLGPNLLRALESMLALVDGYGMSADQMLDVLGSLQAFVQGHAWQEAIERNAIRATDLTHSEANQQQEARIRAIIESGRYPQFARVVTESTDESDPSLVFERRLSNLLDGLSSTFH